MARVIEPCFLHLARQRPAEGVSPEAMASAMMLLNAEGLAKLVDSIDRQLRSGPARRGAAPDLSGCPPHLHPPGRGKPRPETGFARPPRPHPDPLPDEEPLLRGLAETR